MKRSKNSINEDIISLEELGFVSDDSESDTKHLQKTLNDLFEISVSIYSKDTYTVRISKHIDKNKFFHEDRRLVIRLNLNGTSDLIKIIKSFQSNIDTLSLFLGEKHEESQHYNRIFIYKKNVSQLIEEEGFEFCPHIHNAKAIYFLEEKHRVSIILKKDRFEILCLL